MRVLVAGATGAIGRPLVAALNAHGHSVAALTRDPKNVDLLSRLGARPLVADVLDRDATAAALLDFRSEVVVDQLTALPGTYTVETMRAALAVTGAVRTVGGNNLYAAAVAAGARRYVAQSACYYYEPGDGLAAESERWVEHGPPLVAGGIDALTAVEQRTLSPNGSQAGIALRYGFYSGMSPITRASGKHHVVLARYARNRRLADACYLWAFAAITASPGARSYYDARRAAGDTHHRALRALGNRLVGILHGCLRHSTAYNEHTAWAHRQPHAA